MVGRAGDSAPCVCSLGGFRSEHDLCGVGKGTHGGALIPRFDKLRHEGNAIGTGGGFSLLRVDFGYDWQGSRVTKRVWSNTSGTGPLAVDLRFVYDGWNSIAELNATNNAVVRGYVWGLDLSGSPQGGLFQLSTINYQPSTASKKPPTGATHI